MANKKISTNIPDAELAKWEKKYVEGKVTKDEWSRMTPALRLHLNRYYKKCLKEVTKS